MDKTAVATDILAEFLEVAIHLILYTRQLYPLTIFEKRKKYNVPVQMSIHPDLNEYIQNVVKAIKILLSQCYIEKIIIVIFNNRQEPIEKFIFEVKLTDSTNPEIEDQYLLRLEHLIRGFCLKISICETFLQPIPAGCTFGIQIHTNESTAFTLDMEQQMEQFPWVEAEPNETNMVESHIIPLKSTDHELFQMQLYLEENSKKS